MHDDDAPTEAVIGVLRKNGVGVTKDGEKYTLSKGAVLEVVFLGAYCARRMLQRFSRKFDIPIHLLFNPEFPELRRFPRSAKKSDKG